MVSLRSLMMFKPGRVIQQHHVHALSETPTSGAAQSFYQSFLLRLQVRSNCTSGAGRLFIETFDRRLNFAPVCFAQRKQQLQCRPLAHSQSSQARYLFGLVASDRALSWLVVLRCADFSDLPFRIPPTWDACCKNWSRR